MKGDFEKGAWLTAYVDPAFDGVKEDVRSKGLRTALFLTNTANGRFSKRADKIYIR